MVHEKHDYLAIAETKDAKKAHPTGIQGSYTSSGNFIKFGLKDAAPGQYRILLVNYDAARYDFIQHAYVRV